MQGSMILPIFVLFVLTVHSDSTYWHSCFTQGRDSNYNIIQLPQWVLCFKPAVNDGGPHYALPLAGTFLMAPTGPSGGMCLVQTVKLTHSFNFTREEILRHIYELKPYICSLWSCCLTCNFSHIWVDNLG